METTDFKFVVDNIQIVEAVNGKEITWFHAKPDYPTIIKNEGTCAALTNLLKYLVSEDYEEVGFFEMTRPDAMGHAFSYVKQDGKYYVVDLLQYTSGP